MERVRMNNQDLNICLNLRKYLKEKIRGGVFVSINDDNVMTIHINGGKGLRYSKVISNLSSNRYECTRDSIRQLAYEILHDFKDYIMYRYFIGGEI